MKLQSVIPAILFAAAASLSQGVYAADADGQTAAKPMKPHSHMEEKLGVPPSAAPKAAEAAPAAAPAAEEKADKPKGKKTKHFHPRDAK